MCTKCLHLYFAYIHSDIITVQSVIRRRLADDRVEIIRHERDTAAATIIQAKYRSYHSTHIYQSILSKIIAIQCLTRQFIAQRVLNGLKEERRIMEAEMTTKITAAWRRHHCQSVYRRTIKQIILCQSTIRRFASVKELNQLKFQRDTAAATAIETKARAYLAKRHYLQIKGSAVVWQSLVRKMVAYNKLEKLRHERRLLEEREATRITSVWRSYYVRTGYMIVLKGVFLPFCCLSIKCLPQYNLTNTSF